MCETLSKLIKVPFVTADATSLAQTRYVNEEIEAIQDLPLWEGDRHFLPLIFDGDPRPFHGLMPYRDGRMLSWSFSR